MKSIITILILTLSLTTNSQLVVDDFTTGRMSQTNVSVTGEQRMDQTGNKILDLKRAVIIKIKENKDKQLFQNKINNGKLITSIGYGITGVLELRYGHDSNKNLNLNLSQKKNLFIEYQAKSNFGRVYVSMFSNGSNRSYWRGNGRSTELFQGSISPNGSNSPFVLNIPLNEFKNAQDNPKVENKFTIRDVDYIKIQFLSQGIQGLNFAVNKIWFE